jgi:hypothetical protein
MITQLLAHSQFELPLQSAHLQPWFGNMLSSGANSFFLHNHGCYFIDFVMRILHCWIACKLTDSNVYVEHMFLKLFTDLGIFFQLRVCKTFK